MSNGSDPIPIEPLTSMLANAQAAKRWLAAVPPNLTEAIASIDRIVRDARAVGETMQRTQGLFEQESLEKRKKPTSQPSSVKQFVSLWRTARNQSD